MSTNEYRYLRALLKCALLIIATVHAPSTHAQLKLHSIELSPVRIFVSANSDELTTASGTVIFELSNAQTELAFPFLWNSEELTEFDTAFVDNTLEFKERSLVIDAQWRRFNSVERNGGYVGLLARGIFTESDSTVENVNESNFGIGAVAGFRRNISSGFYWGANINLVALLTDANPREVTETGLFFENDVNLTVDFLKIGYQF